ncbi:hypothetical protein HH213_06350 [Duganella dendranthematis]|uniref:Uncharacterized protein n=1 Tax=Duganella dendranthematis TaxID=2728021 RepID=A0ABX6M750_9BURK|nr:hypothetical protein [Duganella dendranthematis]QJD89757.1 hypothetical protein HH213_06350 [Duganella dendranthematis]
MKSGDFVRVISLKTVAMGSFIRSAMPTSYRPMQISHTSMWGKTDAPFHGSGGGRTLITRVEVTVSSS